MKRTQGWRSAANGGRRPYVFSKEKKSFSNLDVLRRYGVNTNRQNVSRAGSLDRRVGILSLRGRVRRGSAVGRGSLERGKHAPR